MKVYKVELMIIDFDEVGQDEIKMVIENQKYPNRCISPDVMRIDERDIGKWDDENPLNYDDKKDAEFQRLFSA